MICVCWAFALVVGSVSVVVVELKRWVKVDSTTWLFTWTRGAKCTHPCRQAAGYRYYLANWLDDPN